MDEINGVLLVKSGTDFRDLTEITVDFGGDKPTFSTTRHSITSDLREDAVVKEMVRESSESMVRNTLPAPRPLGIRRRLKRFGSPPRSACLVSVPAARPISGRKRLRR